VRRVVAYADNQSAKVVGGKPVETLTGECPICGKSYTIRQTRLTVLKNRSCGHLKRVSFGGRMEFSDA
jgi:hypothetical protein